jgi:hypothetical protein
VWDCASGDSFASTTAATRNISQLLLTTVLDWD